LRYENDGSCIGIGIALVRAVGITARFRSCKLMRDVGLYR
jgi:hypothetical protein